MRIQNYLRLLRDPSVKQYIVSLIQTGDVRRLSRVVRLAAKGKRRKILPGFEGLLEDSRHWPQPTAWHQVLPTISTIGDKGSWGAIELASHSWPFSPENGTWSTVFKDPEDGMALHRFGWALRGLDKGARVPWDAVASWLDWIRNEKYLKKVGWAMDGYSVSERICNLALMLHLDPPEDGALLAALLRRLREDSIFVAHNLDYFGDSDTNNHILNNARALIVSGAVLGNDSCYDWGLKLLLQQLPHHCSEDGIFREASSHYQWVITRWMVEVCLLLKKKNAPGAELFTKWSLRMLDVCDRLSLGGVERRYIPRIGDVSPDFPPEWYDGMTETARSLLEGNERSVSRGPRKGWSGIFVDDVRPGKQASTCWTSGDWLRLEANQWSILVHADQETADTRARHGHQDLFSFETAWRDIPVLIDRGRKNYRSSAKSKDSGLLDEWHNSFLIDGKRLGFYPRNFMDGSWIAQNRPKPRFSLNGTAGTLTIRQPKRFPFIQSLQRTWRIEADRIVIRTSIEGSGRHSICCFLYTPFLDIKKSGNTLSFSPSSKEKLILSWEGISFQDMKQSEWYPSYGRSAPCTRIEWLDDVELPWESTFSLICAV